MAERVSKKRSRRKGPLISKPASRGAKITSAMVERMARTAVAMEALEARLAKRRPMGFEIRSGTSPKERIRRGPAISCEEGWIHMAGGG